MKTCSNIHLFKYLYSLTILIICGVSIIHAQKPTYTYAVVVSNAAYSDQAWKKVADSLLNKHSKNNNAQLFIWSSHVTEVKTALSNFKPDYIGYVARPVIECDVQFVVTVSQLSRSLDSDPYGDAIWGIITAYQAEDALRAISDTLIVKTVLAASANISYEPPIQRFNQAIGMTCDSYTKTDYLFSGSNGSVYTENRRPENERDRVNLVSKWLSSGSLNIEIPGKGTLNGPVDCIITGGHGNINMWQCHYPEAGTEGFIRSSNGILYGAPYSGSTIAIHAKTPKIYWCATNCLMGNPGKSNNIVYAAFGSGRAVQMFGFVNNASSGNEFMAWGVYDRVTKCAGNVTLPQGFFLSNNNAMFELRHPGGQINTRLVEQFMDSTVFYGDPAGNVTFYKFDESAHAYSTDLSFTQHSSGNADFTFTFTMNAHDLEYGKGYCYQFRPISLLPVRIDPSTIKITKNEGHTADITDNLMIWQMLSTREKLVKGKSKILQWSAKISDEITGTSLIKSTRNSTAHPVVIHASAIGTTTLFSIFNTSAGNYTIHCIDPSGKLLYSRKFISNGKKQISFAADSNVPVGIYFLSVSHEDLPWINPIRVMKVITTPTF